MDNKELMLLVLGAAAFVALIYLIRFLVKKAVYKGSDAIENAVRRNKNENSSNESQNLSDRYK